MGRPQLAAMLAALAVALAFPMVSDNPYLVGVVANAFIFAIAVYGLNVLLGFAGQLSLAHAGFFGIGAYACGLLMLRGASFWVALPAALVLTVVLGYLVGMVALRTRENYFAIFTLAVGLIITTIIDRWESVTGGTDGLIGIPAPSPIGPIALHTLTGQYYLVLAFLIGAIYVSHSIRRSLLGRGFLAIRNSEPLAAAVGIDVGRNKRLAFAITAGYAGVAGALFAPVQGYLGPSASSFIMTFEMLLFLMLGGVGSLVGPLVGTLAVVALTQALQAFHEYHLVILGPLLVLVVIFFPHGLAGLGSRFVRGAAPPPPETPPLPSHIVPEFDAAETARAGD
jgi:branched-chain amino acid transport system permease protein